MYFQKIITKKPSKSMINGITSAELGIPDYELALIQHENYVNALKSCGVEVIVLDADEKYPDSVFVEDTALLCEKCAVITNPGTDARNGEQHSIEAVLKNYFTNIEHIIFPGTLDGGDVMRVDDHFYIGLSARTNMEGVDQLTKILQKYGYTASTVPVKNILHLKTGLSYIGYNNLLISDEFLTIPAFDKFNKIEVAHNESYASNAIFVNDKLIMPEGFPNAKNAVEKLGYKVVAVDISEFRKLDGGLTCLSLRF